MDILLIFFSIPLATIILSGILETFINNPLKVAGIFFSIFLIFSAALGGSAEYILIAIVYTIISLVTALLVEYFKNRRFSNCTIVEEKEINATLNNSVNPPINDNISAQINSNSSTLNMNSQYKNHW